MGYPVVAFAYIYLAFALGISFLLSIVLGLAYMSFRHVSLKISSAIFNSIAFLIAISILWEHILTNLGQYFGLLSYNINMFILISVMVFIPLGISILIYYILWQL